MKQVTLKQIAERAGTSIGTVDRALNNRGRINPETKAMVLQIAKEMGYQPNKIASALSRGKSLRIAVLSPKHPDYFQSQYLAGLEKAMEHLSNYKIEIIPYRCEYLNSESQIKVIKEIDFSNIDGFSLSASGPELIPYIDEIADMGIPVVTFNSDIPDCKRLFHVGMDPFLAGQVSCNLMAKMLQGKGKIWLFTGNASVLSHNERILGFLDVASQFPDIEILQEREYLDMDSLAYEHTKDMMAKHPDIQGIYTVSCPGIVGVGKYLKTLPKENRPLLVGYDTSSDIRDLLHEGACSFAIYQNPAAQIHYALTYLVEYLMFNNMPQNTPSFLPPEIVVKENVDYYMPGKHFFFWS